MECKEPVQVRFTYSSSQGISEVKVDLLGVQEVRWDKEDTVSAGYYNFYGKGNENHQLGTGFFVHHRIVSQLRVVFLRQRSSCIALRGCCCNIIVVNTQAPS